MLYDFTKVKDPEQICSRLIEYLKLTKDKDSKEYHQLSAITHLCMARRELLLAGDSKASSLLRCLIDVLGSTKED